MEPREEFITLLLRHESEVRGFICAFVLDLHEREDLFQESALIMWRQFAELRNRAAFGSWARGIAGNLILQHRSRSTRQPAALSPEVLEHVRQAFAATESGSNDRRAALQSCIEQLPEHSREILALRYQRNIKAPEIATRLQMSLAAVYKTLSRLRAALAECIGRKLKAGGEAER